MNDDQKAALQDALAPLRDWEGLSLAEIAECAWRVARLADWMQGVFFCDGPTSLLVGDVGHITIDAPAVFAAHAKALGKDELTEEEQKRVTVAAVLDAGLRAQNKRLMPEEHRRFVQYQQPSDEQIAKLEADAKRVCEVIGLAIQRSHYQNKAKP